MDHTLRFDTDTGVAADQGARAAGRGDANGNEDHTGDTLSVSANNARWQRGGLHEGDCALCARDRRPVRCAARGDAARSGAVHTLRSCSTALSATGDALWPAAVAVALATHDTSGDH